MHPNKLPLRIKNGSSAESLLYVNLRRVVQEFSALSLEFYGLPHYFILPFDELEYQQRFGYLFILRAQLYGLDGF